MAGDMSGARHRAPAGRPAEAKAPWLNGTLARQVWALPILDFDPRPKGLPLIGWQREVGVDAGLHRVAKDVATLPASLTLHVFR
jgi:hypothetical protein